MNRRFVLVNAVAGLLLCFAAYGQSIPFRSRDGKITGWKITVAGGRPLATPAIVDGRVFVGGGFGSHEFYAFDAATGKRLWIYHTADDGPTAAAVEDGRIVFNTESCELEVLTTDGRPVWKKWLGDPLMSMPAVADGTVYMAFPNSRGDRKHYLGAFDLRDGRELWRHAIAGEIMTAPVIDGERIYLATVDGSLFSLDRRSGAEIFANNRNATSAPAVWRGQCYFSKRETTQIARNGKTVAQQNEMVAVVATAPNSAPRAMKSTERQADYLDYAKRSTTSRMEAQSQSLDASVGFAGSSKGDAKMSLAMANIGQASVHGVWAYQGSKPFVDHGRLYSSMGDKVLSVDPATEKVIWSRTLHEEKDRPLVDSVLTPPAIVNGKVFVGTSFGEVFVLSAQTGEVISTMEIGEPVVFQPAIAAGRVYVATNNGSLFCLNTGDARDDGWLMWGANATHNGLQR
jgi:Ca-activated chloride channel family protein